MKGLSGSNSQAARPAQSDQEPQCAAAVGPGAAPHVCLKAKINLCALGTTILPLGPGPLGNSSQSTNTGAR